VKQPPTILYCHCAYAEVIPDETRRGVLEALAARGAAFEAVADLCELAAQRDPMLARLAVAADLRIIACWPRTVRWLFAFAGAPLAAEGVRFFNMRREGAEEILAAACGTESGRGAGAPRGGSGDPPRKALRRAGATAGQAGRAASRRAEPRAAPAFPGRKAGEWVPWFPVLDYERCRNCRQCLEFCLFGVYAADEGGQVRVAHPERCKTGCPACARLCPAVAIIFPKYADGAISGDDAMPAAAGRPASPIDFSSLAGLDLGEALRRRQAILRARQEGRREP